MSPLPVSSRALWLWIASASLALGVPMLLAFNLPPSSTFLNQAAALIGWGSWLTILAISMPSCTLLRGSSLRALEASLAVVFLAALVSPFWTHLPWSLALSNAGLIAAAMLTAQIGAATQQEGAGVPAYRALCAGMVLAGVLSSCVGIVQVFAPGWPDGDFIARTYLDGRAVGNMRQPNHLSSLLLWSIVGVVWLGEIRAIRRSASALLAALFIFVVVLSASRTGALSLLLLAAWGALDRRLSRFARIVLLAAPLAYGLFWVGTAAWADQGHLVFGGETRFSGKGDISSSRYGIWSNTLTLIRMHPWWGVGFGEFNFAWSLTPFPGRPVAFFDHTHDVLLQFAVELGLPLAALVLGLLGWALYGAFRAALEPPSEADGSQHASLRRAAFMMVLLILVHSLLEYPLWYAYFLLPASFAFGLCLGQQQPRAAGTSSAGVAPTEPSRPLIVAAMSLMLGSALAVADYARVVVIFAPGEEAPSLAQRIAEGRRSVFFSHHADYAAATTSEHPSETIESFKTAAHYLLDARLMLAWAKALDEAGDTQRARYVAQRLREFRNEQAASFFEPCEEPLQAGAQLPFQCLPPSAPMKYEDFR